ncbi:arsenic resistance N-acetyltransferase ArsN2 [Methanobacterium sp. ACI-7]|uniref:arsenic resistance N-acetyltransferase ArsN2 n=1 Tax=unclassified Methanobacterium TaxID=2627676 RepID=UPI0039C07976
MKDIKITFAGLKDEEAIKKLLSEALLPYYDISDHINNFLLASKDDVIVGVLGVEIHGKSALLRSLAVIHSKQGEGIGKFLYEKMEIHASSKGIKELYLLTTTADLFFENLGFKKIARDEVADAIKNTKEFKDICPVSAVCMVKEINK